MFEVVKTSKQQRNFETTWEYFCDKYSWYNDPYAKDGIRYNLLLPSEIAINQVIGTIEFIPYDPNNPNSTVEGPTKACFSKYKDIRLHQNRVWEIDKVCLHEDFQRKGYFQLFMDIFYDHIKRSNPKYYVAIIEQKFYRMLRISFGLAIEQKGKALIGPKSVLIPVMFDIEKMIEDEEKVRMLFGSVNGTSKQRVKRRVKIYGVVPNLQQKANCLSKALSNKKNAFKRVFRR